MVQNKASGIKLLLLDVDGVLTDGTITINSQGEEIKSFDVKDGQGLKLLIKAGVEIVIVSGRRSVVVEHRAKDLGIAGLYQGVEDKALLCRQLIKQRGLLKEEVCCIGDDLPDLAMFHESGLCIAVADACEEIRAAADLVTQNRGGRGAVRELCEWLLKCKGSWNQAIEGFSGK
ncbi:3-deoxy-D-manno-octulosonate 8-phosphate phosphatase [uncultured Desulfobacterium sp.]|uniref:3-deoxy-D-manno-octulosonate 8-phosphate phosphatase n=1 Tax=uncultured Desulfobacterium sp. TaxID=201089 RepID=A0A445MT33_9BACT|nr:3-deoxy-D-manno-octulosonate 8-phosphate phosphatase [uncultured Desulfobacterium sp.]